jgi:hypothetical protein
MPTKKKENKIEIKKTETKEMKEMKTEALTEKSRSGLIQRPISAQHSTQFE